MAVFNNFYQNHIASYVHDIQAGADYIYKTGQECISKIHETQEWLDRSVCDLADKALSAPHAEVAKKIARAVPEILFTASALTGIGVIPATIFWSIKIVKAAWPLMISFLSGEVNPSNLGQSCLETFNRFKANYASLTPALAVAFGVYGVVQYALGWISSDVHQLIAGTVSFGVAYLAINQLYSESESPRSDNKIEVDIEPQSQPEEYVQEAVQEQIIEQVQDQEQMQLQDEMQDPIQDPTHLSHEIGHNS